MEGLVESIQEDVAGLYFRSVLLPKAFTRIPQHVHPYDHATLVASGLVRVIVNGTTDGHTYKAGEAIEIKAHQEHYFISLADNTRLVCIHHTESAIAAQKVEVESCPGV
jgi:quercetin dioxygenase-like cupin family protein